jgi:cation diffusion facilitator CzcD-associated flavoprotein CzcO
MGSISESQSANGHHGADEQPLQAPIYSERPMRIICIGAGASGLVFAYKLQRSFGNFSLTVYEKNKEISGTWFENRYPGSVLHYPAANLLCRAVRHQRLLTSSRRCACDVAAHNYTWSFEPKPDWSAVYAGSPEIYKYFNDFADKYDVRKYIKMEHQIVGARWNDEAGGWDVEVKNLSSGLVVHDFCNILVNAGGILNAWKWPEIPGLESFKGPKLHTAHWDDSVDLDGKSVGLIGNGYSTRSRSVLEHADFE